MNDINNNIKVKIKSQNGIINRGIMVIIGLIVIPIIVVFSEIINGYKKMVAKGYSFNFTVKEIIYFIIGIVLINILYKVFNKKEVHNKLKIILINIICIMIFLLVNIIVNIMCRNVFN